MLASLRLIISQIN